MLAHTASDFKSNRKTQRYDWQSFLVNTANGMLKHIATIQNDAFAFDLYSAKYLRFVERHHVNGAAGSLLPTCHLIDDEIDYDNTIASFLAGAR